MQSDSGDCVFKIQQNKPEVVVMVYSNDIIISSNEMDSVN